MLDEKYNGVQSAAFEADKERLASGEPLAYVIGYQPFLGLKIYLDSKPLIPRPETEWWTEKLISKLTPGEKPIRVLDLCAGSGAIGCAILARVPQAQVYFSEIDSAHSETIIKNIRENNLDLSRAVLNIGDLFAAFPKETFDVIACNPPYIPVDRELEPSVDHFEPHLALFGGGDGLALIRRIAIELSKHLSKTGVAWIEVDTEHATQAAGPFEEQGFTVEIRTDQYRRPRLLVVSFP